MYSLTSKEVEGEVEEAQSGQQSQPLLTRLEMDLARSLKKMTAVTRAKDIKQKGMKLPRR